MAVLPDAKLLMHVTLCQAQGDLRGLAPRPQCGGPGVVDDLRLYNVALTASQIQEIYNWGRRNSIWPMQFATFLRDELQLDYCSNVTGVDWLERVVSSKEKNTKVVDGKEEVVEETKEQKFTGYLEAVYHLYSVA